MPKMSHDQRVILKLMRDGAYIAMGVFSMNYKLWSADHKDLRFVKPKDVGQMDRMGWITENEKNATEYRINDAGRKALRWRIRRHV